ncbi:MAG: C39 family peptidase, partial [Chloroflexi bacterium]|nr:C39 family peptidase [Chloroflexota bacterium]
MNKRICLLGVFVLLMVAAADPSVVSAGVDPHASPTPRPTERITAPGISGVNPDVVLSEGNQGESHPSDIFIPVKNPFPITVDLPPYVQVKPQSIENFQNDGSDLAVPLRSQGFGQVNCGPAALDIALTFLGPVSDRTLPTTQQITSFLSSRGLMYDWGTGVEELAFAAREFGYAGSTAFHDWSFEELADQQGQGVPVVLSLGTNGADQPGHFVTLSGISEDGLWITVIDPLYGKRVLSRDEFNNLWKLQGNAGLIARKKALPTEADPMLPWMGLFGALSMFGLALNQGESWRESRTIKALRRKLANPRRKGIGGGPIGPEEPEVIKIPRYETKTVYRGIKTIQLEVPVYETRKVKVGIRGIKKQVPQYETRSVLVGYKEVAKQVPIYTTKRVRTGTKLVQKEIPITRYHNKEVLVWKKQTTRVPVYKKIGSKRFIIGYKNETRWKKVPVTKKVLYQTTKKITLQLPIYKKVKVISGYKAVIDKVPEYIQKRIQVGFKTIEETVPVFEERKIQVGTKIVTRQVPNYQTVKIPILPQKEACDPGNGAGESELTNEEQKLIEKISPEKDAPSLPIVKTDKTDTKWWIKALTLIQEKVFDPIEFFKNHPDQVLKTIKADQLPKFLSVSAKAAWDFNLFSQEGMLVNTNLPPGIWQIFYMQQKFKLEQKAVVTVNPGSLVDFYFTSASGSVKLTKNLSYIFGPGEMGISIKKGPDDERFDYSQSKHSIEISLQGWSYKHKKEGVKKDDFLSTKDYEIKQVTTLACETRTMKTEGILLATIVGVVFLETAVPFLLKMIIDWFGQTQVVGASP